MGLDVLEALQANSTQLSKTSLAEPAEASQAEPPTLYVLPRVMFDHPDTITLDDIAPQDIANRLQTPIALADTLGDVWDALTGQSQTMYLPDLDDKKPSSIPLRTLTNDDLSNNTHDS
jgi:hypothetical protein